MKIVKSDKQRFSSMFFRGSLAEDLIRGLILCLKII